MDQVFISSPVGTLKLSGTAQGLVSVQFVDDFNASIPNAIPPVLQDAVIQLEEYFAKKRTVFNLKLVPQGTTFQQTVWQQLQEIPFGKTQSYLQMANKLGNPKVIRAAASANGKNPIAIIIPCHRVIGADGSLTGYAGGLNRKKWLLNHESPVAQQSLF
tara:strand:- start:2424 stop:2900 length:477 start_codon:yes stop_codon:yes gene_type:complete